MHNSILKWLIVVAVALFIVSILVFWFGGSSFSESRVLLAINGPTQSAVGDEVIYKVHYENTTNTTLKNLSLTFTYPANAIIIKDGSIVDNPSHVETVQQPTLNAGQFMDQEFHVFLVGDRGDIKVAKAVLDFLAGSLKSPFEKTATLSTTITSLPVSLTLAAAPSTSPGAAVSYLLDYRNDSGSPISDLQFVFTYPDGFVPTRFSPNPSKSPDTWSLNTLSRSGSGRITINGTLDGNEGQSKTITVTLKRNVNGTLIDYEKSAATTVIASPLLNVSLSANGSVGYISHTADQLQYVVSYKNNSPYTLTGLTMAVHLDGDMYDFSTVDTHQGFFDSNAHTITWNSTVIPDFLNLRPGQTGSAVFSIKTKSALSGGGSNNLLVHATATLATNNVPQGVDGDTVNAQDDLITKITSQPSFQQTAFVSDSAFGASGAWPPKAGQETIFTIHWKVTNPGSDLASAKLTATLPQGVKWKNVTSVPNGLAQPTFNANTSQIVWTPGVIPQNTGINNPPYELVFQIGFTPSTTQIGLAPIILQSSTLSGIDNFTKQTIVVPSADINTNTTADRSGQGNVTQ